MSANPRYDAGRHSSLYEVRGKLFLLAVLLGLLLVLQSFGVNAAVGTVYNFSANGTFSDATATIVLVEAWGGGGGGKGAYSTNCEGMPGGGGGAYVRSTFNVKAGSSYAVIVGAAGAGSTGAAGSTPAGSTGGYSAFISDTILKAAGGTGGGAGSYGGNASNSVGEVIFSGGNGHTGGGCGVPSGGGGGGAGNESNGTTTTSATGGAGGNYLGGKGGDGRATDGAGTAGSNYSAGGGGSYCDGTCGTTTGGSGAPGFVRITVLEEVSALTVTPSNVVNGSVLGGFCATLSNSSYSSNQCTTGTAINWTTGNSMGASQSSLTLPLTSATAFNGSATDTSPNAIQATLNGKTLQHGTLTNHPVLNSSGRYGNAFTFNTSSSAALGTQQVISLGNSTLTQFNDTTPFTISLWIYSQGSCGTNTTHGAGIIARKFRYAIYFSNNINCRPAFQFRNSTASGTALTTGYSLSTGWHYITANYDGSTMRWYINGVLNSSQTNNIINVDSQIENLIMGSSSAIGAGNANPLNSTLDEVRIWNASLSAAEILAEMNSAYPVRGQNLVASYSFELNNITAGASLNTTADTNYLINGSASGEGAYTFDGVDDYLNSTNNTVYALSSDFTINLWVRPAAVSTGSARMDFLHKNSGNNGWYVRKDTNSANVFMNLGNGSFQSSGNVVGISANTWQMITFTRNGTQTNAYLNGVRTGGNTVYGSVTSTTTSLKIGGGNVEGASPTNGSVSNVIVFSRALESWEVRDLYNRQSLGFGSYNVTIYNITGGSASPSYFNQTRSVTWDTTETVNIPTYQALLSITAKQLFTNNTLTGFNITNNMATNTTVTTSITIPANNGSNNLQLDHAGNYSKNQTCTATSPLTTAYCNITGVYDGQYNITAYHLFSGSPINNFSVNVTNSTLGGILYSQNTTNGTITFPVIQGYQYFYLIMGTGYAWNNATLASNATAQTYNFSLYTTNIVNFTFYDENNGSDMNGTNITLSLIGSVMSATYNTVNGTIITAVMSPDAYTVRYSAAGFAERFYLFSLANNTYYSFSLPMLQTGAATSVTVSVIDNTAQALSGAVVSVYKYDVSTNTYKINQVFTTNNEGEGVINVELNDEFYYFTVTYGGVIVLTTSPRYLYAATLQLTVLTQNPAFQKLFNQYGISGSLSNTTPTLFTFTYADSDYRASRGCLYAYRYGTNNLTLYNSTCNTGSGGTASVGIDSSTNKTYYLYGVVRKDGTDYNTITRIVSFTWRATTESSKKIWLAVMVLIIVILVMMFRESPGLAAILAGLVPVLFSWAGMISFGLGYTIPLLIISIIIAYIIERN